MHGGRLAAATVRRQVSYEPPSRRGGHPWCLWTLLSALIACACPARSRRPAAARPRTAGRPRSSRGTCSRPSTPTRRNTRGDAAQWWEARAADRRADRRLDADAVALRVPLARWDALAELQPLDRPSCRAWPRVGAPRPPGGERGAAQERPAACVRAESRSPRADHRARRAHRRRRARRPRHAPPSSSQRPPRGGRREGGRFQLRSLLKRVQLLRTAGEPFDALPAAPLPLVLAGDFKHRSSPLHRLLAAAEPPPQQPWPPAPAPALVGAAAAVRRVRRRAAAWGPPLRLVPAGRLLDFVWTSPAVELLRTMPVPAAAGAAQPPLALEEQPSTCPSVPSSWAGAPPPCARRCARRQLFVQHVTE